MKKVDLFNPYREVIGIEFYLDENTYISYSIKEPIENPNPTAKPAQLIAKHLNHLTYLSFSDYSILHWFLAKFFQSRYSLIDCQNIMDEIRNNCLIMNNILL